MKLLKTIGKILAIPFDLIVILGKISLLPATIISKLLSGEFTEWNKKRKFLGSSISALFNSLRNGKDYSFLMTIGYTKEGKYYERLECFSLSKGNIIHSVNYVKTK
jgi:hypothetical protein